MNRTKDMNVMDKSLTYDDLKPFGKSRKRESLLTQHKNNEIYNASLTKKHNSSWGMRKGESEGMNLYNRTDKKLKRNMIESRNNAYNSLVERYKMASVIEKNNFDNVLPVQKMSKAISHSFNVTNVADINSESLYA